MQANTINFAYRLQLFHIGLSAIWNFTGIMLLLRGLPPLGPTASVTTLWLLLMLAVMMTVGLRYSNWLALYVIASLLAGAGAILAIIPAFYLSAEYWPSLFWRVAGILINSIGVLGAAWGLMIVGIAKYRQ